MSNRTYYHNRQKLDPTWSIARDIAFGELSLHSGKLPRFQFHVKVDGQDVPCLSVNSVAPGVIELKRPINISDETERLFDLIDGGSEMTISEYSDHPSPIFEETFRVHNLEHMADEDMGSYKQEVIRCRPVPEKDENEIEIDLDDLDILDFEDDDDDDYFLGLPFSD